MTSANNFLNVNSLNFSEIKNNFKTYLKNQGEFSDYDFDSSALSILLDVLAYNTYYQNMYLNMNVNETFLKTALLRENVVARAQEINYVPRSSRSSHAQINVKIVPNDNPQEIIIPAYTKFVTELDNIRYTFSTEEDYTVTKDKNGNYLKTIDIFEGTVLVYRFIVNDVIKKYTLNNINLDTESLVVNVYPTSSSTDKTNYVHYKNINELSETSKVYFLEENLDETYDVFFGDGVLGFDPPVGSLVEITARFCHGSKTNGLRSFIPLTYVGYNRNIPTTLYEASSVTLITSAFNGMERENLESVQYLAPKFFQAQDRLVTKTDYRSFILSKYGDLQSVSVWGGEENNPPYFGKTLISVKPKNGFTIPVAKKEQIVKDITEKSIMAIDPLVVDPVFTFVNLNMKINYDSTLTSLTFYDLYNKISDATKKYEKDNLGVFDNGFYLSKFAASIDEVDNSIQNTEVNVYLEKRLLPVLNDSITYEISWNTPVYHPYNGYLGGLTSTAFTMSGGTNSPCYFDDDGYGNLRIYQLSGTNKIYLNKKAGTINYSEGKIKIDSIIFLSVYDGSSEIRILINPDQKLYKPVKNEILLFSYPKITIFDLSKNLVSLVQTVDVNGNVSPIKSNNIFIPVIK